MRCPEILLVDHEDLDLIGWVGVYADLVFTVLMGESFKGERNISCRYILE